MATTLPEAATPSLLPLLDPAVTALARVGLPRGVAILLAALAIGLGAASNETERPATAYPTSPHATTR